MMGSMMKSETDRLTLKISGDGPVGGLVAVANAKAEVKGYAQVPDVLLPPSPAGKLDVGRAVGAGTLSVTRSIGMGEPFTTTGTTYEVKITSPTTADVTLKDAQFMDKMPQQTIQLKNVPIVATTNGYRIEAAEVVPCINDVPFEKYKITNLYLSTINKAKSFNLKFNCTYSGITFKIVANANLFPKTNEK